VPGEIIPTPRGSDPSNLYTWAQALATVLTRRFAQGDKNLANGLDDAAGLEQDADLGHWLLEAPDDKTYTIVGKLKQPVTITEVTTITKAGSCTVTVKINGVALGGTANSASTSAQSQSHTTANEAVAGDTIDIVVSSNSGAEMLTVDISGTVTLDP